MKKLNFKRCVLSFITLISLAACTGFDQDLKGVLDIFENFSINHSDNKSINIQPGTYDVSMSFENGVLGVKNPELILKLPNKEVAISLPRKAFNEKSKTIQASASEIKQNFSISGRVQTVTLNHDEVEGRESCSKCDFCMQGTTQINSQGNVESTSSFGYNCACTGIQDVLYNKDTLEDRYVLNFLNGKNQKAAVFNGKGTPYLKTSRKKELNECR